MPSRLSPPSDLWGAAASGVQALPGLPRLPVVPDLLRRIDMPDDLDAVFVSGEEAEPRSVGMSRAGVERIWEAALGMYRSGAHPALQLSVRRKGAVVIDRAIGHAFGNGPGERGVEKVPVSLDTPFVIYSASKAITALVVHLLDQQGELHIGDPVCEYVPGFAKHGKEAITIAQVLAHRAGVPNLSAEALELDVLSQPGRIAELINDTRPLSRPGKMLAYHAVSGGFILGEVVRQVTGQSIREVLRERVLEPVGGFEWMNYGVEPGQVDQVGRSYPTGAPVPPPLSNQLTKVLSHPVDEVTRLSNDPRFLTGVIPAANIVTSARELSRFYELVRQGGSLDGGTQIWEPRTLRRALTEQSYLEVDRSLGFPTRFSYGLMLGSKRLSLYGPDTERAFGHLGFTNILAWADPERALSVALITSGKPVLYPEVGRFWSVGARIGIEARKVRVKAADDPLDARSQ